MKNNNCCIAVDVMGGDYGPSALIPGSLEIARKKGISLKLVGRLEAIKSELEKHNIKGIDFEVVHADEVANMSDKPSYMLRRKRNTSIQVCYNLVREGKAEGVISAGPTGATLATGIFTLGRIKGIERPAVAALLPREKKPLILIDVGANVDSKSRHLVQFAIMADVLAKKLLNILSPQIGLLNIGEEQGKGNLQVNEAYHLLSKTDLNFVGNVEGRELFSGDFDIAICDGFVGNVALKLSEGLGDAFSKMLRKELKIGFFTRLGVFFALPAFRRFMRKMDYEEYGGAPLLGLNGTVFICHGSAQKKAVAKTLDMSATFINTKANEEIRFSLEANPEITRFQRLKKILHSTSTKGSLHSEDQEEES